MAIKNDKYVDESYLRWKFRETNAARNNLSWRFCGHSFNRIGIGNICFGEKFVTIIIGQFAEEFIFIPFCVT